MDIWYRATMASSAPSGFADELPVAGASLRLNAANLAALWQDSALSTPATASGDPVGGWSDTSGNDYHALQATSGNRPLLQLASMNGLPIVRFDGSNDVLLAPLIHAGYEMTTFVVLRHISGVANSAVASLNLASGNDGGTYSAGLLWGWSNDGAQYCGYRAGELAPATRPANGVAHVYSSVSDGVGYEHWANGASLGYATGPGTTLPFNITVAAIGSRYSGGAPTGNYLHADVAEFVVYPFALDSTERGDVEAFLTTKWGL